MKGKKIFVNKNHLFESMNTTLLNTSSPFIPTQNTVQMVSSSTLLTLAPTELATSRSLVLNSRGRQLHIFCCNLSASRHLAAPSIASIWQSLSPIPAADPIALSYCRYAFWKTQDSSEQFCNTFSSSRCLSCLIILAKPINWYSIILFIFMLLNGAFVLFSLSLLIMPT